MLDPIQSLAGVAAGSLVGFTLSLAGGGGSVLGLPLMVYLVGVPNPHVAVGTSALAVAANAAVGLLGHVRRGTVRWRCALCFAAAGVLGAAAGARVGMAIDGTRLLVLFALFMILVGALMLRPRAEGGGAVADCTGRRLPRVVGFGGATGMLSGVFGIGGGVLIVPGLIASTGMPILNAVGSSLVAVTAFGLTTAVHYALSDLVDWPLAVLFVAGGVAGSLAGARAAQALALRKGALNRVFAAMVFAVAGLILAKSIGAP